jgi:cytochrome c556
MSMIITKNGKDAKKIDKLDIEKETQLQEYIHDNPESIPVYEIEENKRLFVVAREFSTESGPIDALAIDKDGDIYVVETKINKNPDKRMVVAQALDYGASLWRHSDLNEFITKINTKIYDKFGISFEEKAKKFFDIDDEQFALAVASIKRNLQDGNIKFVILMDSIEDRLKDLIVYVNQNSQFDIYAVQLEYYKFDEYEIMIPKLFGVEVKKGMSRPTTNQRKIWNEQDFIIQVKEKLGNDAEKIIKLYNFLKLKTDKIKWGTGNANGSFAPIIKRLSETISPFSIYSDGTFLIKFSWLKNHAEKNIFDKFFNTFVKEITKLKIKITEDELLKNSFEIKSQDFLNNYEEIVSAIKITVEIK